MRGQTTFLKAPTYVWTRAETQCRCVGAITLQVRWTNPQLRPHLIYLVLVEWNLSCCYFLPHLHQMFLDVLHYHITTLVGQDLTNHVAAKTKGESTSDLNAYSKRLMSFTTGLKVCGC